MQIKSYLWAFVTVKITLMRFGNVALDIYVYNNYNLFVSIVAHFGNSLEMELT